MLYFFFFPNKPVLYKELRLSLLFSYFLRKRDLGCIHSDSLTLTLRRAPVHFAPPQPTTKDLFKHTLEAVSTTHDTLTFPQRVNVCSLQVEVLL